MPESLVDGIEIHTCATLFTPPTLSGTGTVTGGTRHLRDAETQPTRLHAVLAPGLPAGEGAPALGILPGTVPGTATAPDPPLSTLKANVVSENAHPALWLARTQENLPPRLEPNEAV